MSKKILLTLTLCLAMSLLLSPLSAFALKKGDPFPDLKGATLDGGSFELSSLKGEPILLKVGTTWCGTCKSQYETISQISDYLKENHIRFVDVFIQEKEKTVRKYLTKGDTLLPDAIILDQGEIHKALNVYLIPRVLLIDKNYRVYRDGSDLSADELKQMISSMLAES